MVAVQLPVGGVVVVSLEPVAVGGGGVGVVSVHQTANVQGAVLVHTPVLAGEGAEAGLLAPHVDGDTVIQVQDIDHFGAELVQSGEDVSALGLDVGGGILDGAFLLHELGGSGVADGGGGGAVHGPLDAAVLGHEVGAVQSGLKSGGGEGLVAVVGPGGGVVDAGVVGVDCQHGSRAVTTEHQSQFDLFAVDGGHGEHISTGVHLGNFGSGIGSGVGGGSFNGSGVGRFDHGFILGAAGHQAEQHGQREEQRQELSHFLHNGSPFIVYTFYRVPICD